MSLKAQVIAINKLLSDIYQREMRLSYLLSELDFDREDIKLISHELLSEVVNVFIENLTIAVTNFRDGARLFTIIRDNYGLTGNSQQTLRQLGAKLDIGHERVRQLKEKALRKLKSTTNLSLLEAEFKQEVVGLIQQFKHGKFSEENVANTDTNSITTEQKYSFQSSVLANGDRCLIISQGKERIVITESDFAEFYRDFVANIQSLQWGNFKGGASADRKTYSLEEIRNQHKRAYEPWTQEEDTILTENLAEGLNVKEIAELLERQPGAISSRIKKLGLR